MMTRSFFLAILLFMAYTESSAQVISRFDIEVAAGAPGMETPASIPIDNLKISMPKTFRLMEVVDGKRSMVPVQLDKKNNQLTWLVTAPATPVKHHYELMRAEQEKMPLVNARDKDGTITIVADDKNLLRYVHKTVYPPAGIDTNYKRSAFIHPLWTPHGQELTRIQPTDHYHHYGIWNPWTHTLFENDTVDFWNIKGHQGTVRFARFNSITEGPVFAEFEALHEHVVFKKDGTEKVALNEKQTVRVYHPSASKEYYLVDVTSELSCASSSPLLILAYRYAGFGWRATEYWDRNNSSMLTSEQKTRENTDGSKARWCIVQGALPGNDSGGAVMLSHPGNYNHPEPLRIWDKNANGGRGDVFANFAPTKDKDWLLEPGKTYTLRYRLVVFNGQFDAASAESAWQYYAKPPAAK